jgi:hypothetical protein
MRRISDDRPTLIEVSARALKNVFLSVESTRDAGSRQAGVVKTGARSRPAYDRAMEALKSLFGGNIPSQADTPNSVLCNKVGKWLKDNNKPSVSDETILRAARRRRK